jgi:mannose-6-phosphate isomerase-like protein (cupin superfamily)
MKIQRLASHPDFQLEGNSTHFGRVWEVELESGEQTQPHQHDDLEEIYCFVEGTGEIWVAQKKQPVARGEVIHVPPLTNHFVLNTSVGRLRCLAIESHPQDRPSTEERPAERETVGSLEKLITEMPKEMDQVAAIKQIVGLFDVAGRLSEQIEEAFGLDNEEGVEALSRIEKKIMDAVVEITRRYQRRHGGELDLGGFGGRLNLG